MSETPEAAPAPDAAPVAPKASKLPIILAAVNFVAILGLGGYFVYTQQHAAAQAKKAEDKAGEKEEGEHGEEKAAHGEEGAEEEEAEEESEPAGGGHGEKKAAGHGEEKAAGHGEKKGGHGEEAASSDEHAAGGPLLELSSMVTNLAEPDSDRYLKVSMQVRITGEAARAEVEAQMVPVRNQILLYLSSLTVADTSGADNKRDIQKKVKRIISNIS